MEMRTRNGNLGLTANLEIYKSRRYDAKTHRCSSAYPPTGVSPLARGERDPRCRRGPDSEEWVFQFREHCIEYGQTYESAAVADADAGEPASPDDVRLYVPSTRPGAPLPHAELEDADGRRVAVMSLVRPGEFLLIAGEDGEPWCAAAKRLAETARLPLRAVRIGHLDGDYRDPRCSWLRHRRISPRGAILVRPDRFVGWRRIDASPEPAAELQSALSRILCRRKG